jgi:hypothetical protein
MNGRQRPGPIQDRQLPRIPPVRFDAIAGAARNEGGRDHVTGDVMRGQRTLELKATGARFVATRHRSLTTTAFDEPDHRATVRRQRVQRRRPVRRQQHRSHGRRGVLIESDDGCRLHHDRPPLYAALLRAVAG